MPAGKKRPQTKNERAKLWRGWQTTVSMILSSICHLCVGVKEEGWGLRRLCLWKSEERCRGWRSEAGKEGPLHPIRSWPQSLPSHFSMKTHPVDCTSSHVWALAHSINSFLYSSSVGTSCPHHPTGQGGEKKPPNPSRSYQQLSCSLSLNQHSCLCYRQLTLIKQCHTR